MQAHSHDYIWPPPLILTKSCFTFSIHWQSTPDIRHALLLFFFWNASHCVCLHQKDEGRKKKPRLRSRWLKSQRMEISCVHCVQRILLQKPAVISCHNYIRFARRYKNLSACVCTALCRHISLHMTNGRKAAIWEPNNRRWSRKNRWHHVCGEVDVVFVRRENRCSCGLWLQSCEYIGAGRREERWTEETVVSDKHTHSHAHTQRERERTLHRLQFLLTVSPQSYP